MHSNLLACPYMYACLTHLDYVIYKSISKKSNFSLNIKFIQLKTCCLLKDIFNMTFTLLDKLSRSNSSSGNTVAVVLVDGLFL